MLQATSHIPVMLPEALENLRAVSAGRYLDCTLGGAGHTLAILQANAANQVTALDRDKQAVERARAVLTPFAERLKLLHADFKKLSQLVFEAKFHGVLADLGISSDQLSAQRGFSFQEAAGLDMRMDQEQQVSAEQIINQSSDAELYKILKQGGVRQEARAAVQAILRARPIEDTKHLAGVLAEALARHKADRSTHPATVVFQAIRIAVNDELGQLRALLAAVPTLVEGGARLVMISFHSLEDQIVTKTMRDWAGAGFSASFPGSRPKQILGSVLTRSALTPCDEEIESNPRSRSARMRVFEFA